VHIRQSRLKAGVVYMRRDSSLSDSTKPGSRPGQLISALMPLSATTALAISWQQLAQESPCSFFQSWLWMQTWLESFADVENMHVFECRREGALIGLALLGRGTVRRRMFFTSDQIVLNESADANRNMLVEYNELLCRPNDRQVVAGELFRVLACTRGWDEFRIAYGSYDDWMPQAASRPDINPVIESVSTSWVTPLNAATTIDSLLAGLSANKRYQIRRSFKEYEKGGPLTVTAAADADEALRYFRALGELHTQAWRDKGQAGSFARGAWVRFHETLIRAGYGAGNVQLLRIRCGAEDIGYIYNLIWRGTAMMIQTGFQRGATNQLRPGYVSHLLAMQLNAGLGMTGYDFMPGNDEYKRVLAKPAPQLVSVRFQRRRLKFRVESTAVRAVRAARRWLAGRRPGKSTMESLAVLAFASSARITELGVQMESLPLLVFCA
jgi:CelD/BcsL family acetyltransferase involved in cellulose biosynthesis